jgi:WhiB family redox-sensing transcriptional regulator
MLLELSDEVLEGLAVLLDAERWKRDALCTEHPEVQFFPERGESSEPAKATCRKCLAREDCLRYALDEAIKCGIWGGLSERERRKVRATERAAA